MGATGRKTGLTVARARWALRQDGSCPLCGVSKPAPHPSVDGGGKGYPGSGICEGQRFKGGKHPTFRKHNIQSNCTSLAL